MADIRFDEDQDYQHSADVRQKSFLVRLVLATGVVSSDRAAEYVLLVIAVCFITAAFMVPFLIGGNAQPMTDQDIQRIIRLQQNS